MDAPLLKKPNRLLKEKSPYLLQHAYNPVDWFPWGEEAFAKAREEDKPILVSIGYSTCHWCHVMEKETFEDPTVGELMNHTVVAIKVDREERPDIDKIYMTSVSAMTGSGGWPLNIFLTPELKPFYGGTYFPPKPRWGQPAWSDLLTQLAQSWKNPAERARMVQAGEEMTTALQSYIGDQPGPAEGDPSWFDQTFQSLKSSFDMTRGGFSPAPKFPMPGYIHFLFRYFARTQTDSSRAENGRYALEMAQTTLREMARGGIYDQLGGGFSRYSTDAQWHLPHFEKMLYDNAQLVVNYLEAYQIDADPEWARIARETLAYVQRDLTHLDGGFYSAEDADSLPAIDAPEKKEGAFYAWSRKELVEALGREEAEGVSYRFGARDQGNVSQDPHGEFTGQNILYAAHSIDDVAHHMRRTPDATALALRQAQAILFTRRTKRPRPHLDDKILTAWNGLMISGFAKAYQVLQEKSYLAAGQNAARFLRQHLWDDSSHQLFRTWRDGQTSGPGISDDYAFLAQGLLDLYEAGGGTEWLRWAEVLTDEMLARFYDARHGGFFMTALNQDPNLLLRVKELQDNVEPSASSIAALNLLRLSQMRDRPDYVDPAKKTIESFGAVMRDSPRAAPHMLVALDFALAEPFQASIIGSLDSEGMPVLLQTLQTPFIPVKTVMWQVPEEGTPPASVTLCYARACHPPVSDPQKLETQLRPFSKSQKKVE